MKFGVFLVRVMATFMYAGKLLFTPVLNFLSLFLDRFSFY